MQRTLTEFTFDAAGRLIEATDSDTGAVVEEYDVLDRLVRETTPQGTISYAYDPLGRRTAMTVDGQSPVTYTYDAASRLRTITQAPLAPVDIQYDTIGRRTLLTLPNGVSTEYQYDVASRLTALIYRNAFGPLGDLTYEYDPAGNRTAVGGSFARTLLPDALPSATYDEANQQLAFGHKAMAFDPNGNLATITDPSGTTTFTWNARNSLVALDSPGASGIFSYDAFNRRALKNLDGVETTYQYDAWNVVRELVSGVDASYLQGLISSSDETLVRAGDRFFLRDALGSTVGLTDPTGSVVTEYVYSPFGVTSLSGVASPNPFQYAGRENDGTGLYHYRFRYSHPGFKRFVSEDQISLLAGARNMYAYVGNNPVNFVDPWGLEKQRCCPDGKSRSVLECYSRCVHTLLIDPVKYAYGLLTAGAVYAIGATPVTVGGVSGLTAAEAAGGFLAGRIGLALGTITTVEEVTRVVITGAAVGGAIVTAAQYIAVVTTGYALGVEIGCVARCAFDACSY